MMLCSKRDGKKGVDGKHSSGCLNAFVLQVNDHILYFLS